jgi:hypothetical protein
MLTNEQMMFLKRQKIELFQMFNAQGLTKVEYHAEMKREDKLFAYGVKECGSGHSLRTRAGHCIECNTANIAFMVRHNKRATVYVAASRSIGIIKIGSSTQLPVREEQIRKYAYAGATDWIIVSSVLCDNAGKVEKETQKKLKAFQWEATYVWEGRETDCYEVFKCGYPEAHKALIEVLPDNEKMLLIKNMRPDAAKNYNFSL